MGAEGAKWERLDVVSPPPTGWTVEAPAPGPASAIRVPHLQSASAPWLGPSRYSTCFLASFAWPLMPLCKLHSEVPCSLVCAKGGKCSDSKLDSVPRLWLCCSPGEGETSSRVVPAAELGLGPAAGLAGPAGAFSVLEAAIWGSPSWVSALPRHFSLPQGQPPSQLSFQLNGAPLCCQHEPWVVAVAEHI